MKINRAASLSLSILAAILGCALQPTSAYSAPEGVQFTKDQDLDPTKSSNNRPIHDKWAVVIGASRYATSRLDTDQPFDAAARNFQSYLIDPHGGRFQKSHVKTLINKDASSRNILSTLSDGYLSGVAEPDDLVVVFIATRGVPTTDGTLYLCTHDITLNNIAGTCVSVQQVMDTLKTKIKAKRIVLILEASGSGAADLVAGGTRAVEKAANVDVDKLNVGEGFIVLSSSKANEVTWGTQFSTELVKALRENDGMASLQAAFAAAQSATEAATAADPKRANKQTPVINWKWTGKDMVIGAPISAQSESTSLQAKLGAEAHYLKANQSVLSGDFNTAAKEYEAAIAEDPFYADAIADYGAMLAMQKNWAGAASQFELAIKARPDDSLFHYNYARVLSKLNRQDDSFAELQKAYELNARDRQILTALADGLNKRGQFDKSIEYLQQALILAPQDADIYTRMSGSFALKGDVPGAVQHAQKAIGIDKGFINAYLALGNVYLGSGDPEKAAQTYRDALAVQPQNADAHLNLGKALQQLNQNNAAVDEFNKFLQLCSGNDPRIEDTRKRVADIGKI